MVSDLTCYNLSTGQESRDSSPHTSVFSSPRQPARECTGGQGSPVPLAASYPLLPQQPQQRTASVLEKDKIASKWPQYGPANTHKPASTLITVGLTTSRSDVTDKYTVLVVIASTLHLKTTDQCGYGRRWVISEDIPPTVRLCRRKYIYIYLENYGV